MITQIKIRSLYRDCDEIFWVKSNPYEQGYIKANTLIEIDAFPMEWLEVVQVYGTYSDKVDVPMRKANLIFIN